MSYEFNEAQKLWLAALRSGCYKQGTNGALSEEGTYCCLGVACEIAPKFGVVLTINHPVVMVEDEFTGEESEVEDDTTNWYSGHSEDAPASVTDALKLRGSLGEFEQEFYTFDKHGNKLTGLAGLNDSDEYSFEKIADFIEANPEKVFKS